MIRQQVPAPCRPTAVIHTDIHLQSNRARTAVDHNIFGAKAVATFASSLEIPVIHLSSIVAQGPSKSRQPHRDFTPSRPVGPIAASLFQAEKTLGAHRSLDSDIFRLAVPYGYNGGFEQTYRNIQRSRVRPLFENLELSFIHLDDVANLIELRLENRSGGSICGHVSDGVVRTSEDFLNAMELRGPTALRLPLVLTNSIWGLTERLSAPFGTWSMLRHFAHAPNWTSLGFENTSEIPFSPQVNWKNYLARLNQACAGDR